MSSRSKATAPPRTADCTLRARAATVDDLARLGALSLNRTRKQPESGLFCRPCGGADAPTAPLPIDALETWEVKSLSGQELRTVRRWGGIAPHTGDQSETDEQQLNRSCAICMCSMVMHDNQILNRRLQMERSEEGPVFSDLCPMSSFGEYPWQSLLGLPCGHVFHAHCIKKLWRTRLDIPGDDKEFFNEITIGPDASAQTAQCPSCRTPFKDALFSCRHIETSANAHTAVWYDEDNNRDVSAMMTEQLRRFKRVFIQSSAPDREGLHAACSVAAGEFLLARRRWNEAADDEVSRALADDKVTRQERTVSLHASIQTHKLDLLVTHNDIVKLAQQIAIEAVQAALSASWHQEWQQESIALVTMCAHVGRTLNSILIPDDLSGDATLVSDKIDWYMGLFVPSMGDSSFYRLLNPGATAETALAQEGPYPLPRDIFLFMYNGIAALQPTLDTLLFNVEESVVSAMLKRVQENINRFSQKAKVPWTMGNLTVPKTQATLLTRHDKLRLDLLKDQLKLEQIDRETGPVDSVELRRSLANVLRKKMRDALNQMEPERKEHIAMLGENVIDADTHEQTGCVALEDFPSAYINRPPMPLLSWGDINDLKVPAGQPNWTPLPSAGVQRQRIAAVFSDPDECA